MRPVKLKPTNILAVALSVVGLAACGTKAPTQSGKNSPPKSTTTSTTSTTSTSTTQSQVGPSNCTATMLNISLGRTSAGAGSVAVPMTVQNSSTSICQLSGYPSLQLMSGSTKLKTVVTDGSSVSVPSEPVTTVTLSPGSSAYFIFGFADATGYSGVSCPTSTDLLVSVNDSKPIQVAIKIAAYGGTVQNLQCGSLATTPILPALPQGF